jgi:ssDNA-binding Zn-finger/Zn-ribbon topoisomerase 1
MAPTKTDTGHGPLFDSFPDRPQSLHGGAKFDEGFNLQPKGKEKGRNFDEFGQPIAPENGAHGEVFDDWREWDSMPDSHGGTLFDEGFDSPSANETSRGPLFDLFEPSTQVKFIYDGQDSEGIVDHVREDGMVMVTPRGGGSAVEVDLGQFLGYRSPSMDNASTVADRSTAESPSAWDQIAHGAKRGAAPDPGRPVETVSEGPGNTNSRSDISADWSIVDHLKTMLGGDDVEKVAGYHMHLKDGFARHTLHGKQIGTSRSMGGTEGGVVAHHKQGESLIHIGNFPSHELAHTAILGAHGAMGKTRTVALPSELLKSHSEWAGVTTIAKDISSAEVAVQAQDGAAPFAGSKGAGTYCPECRKTCKPTEDGRCPNCQQTLKAHEGHKIVPREKGDLNGTAENSATKTSAMDDLHKAMTGVSSMKPRGSGMLHLDGARVIGTSRPAPAGGVHAHHGIGDAKVFLGKFGSHKAAHTAIVGREHVTKSLDEVRKAFGAAGDPGAGGQTVTTDGSDYSRGQQKGQATSDPEDVEIPERAHPDSDHHSNMSGVPTSCPHCGEVIAQLDAKAEQGAPAHKCIEGLLGVVKTEESALDALRSLVAA